MRLFPRHTEIDMAYQFINAPDLVGHWINGQADGGSDSRRAGSNC